MTTGTDTSYDMRQAGRKVRVLNSALNIDYRDLAGGMSPDEALLKLENLKKRLAKIEDTPVYSGQNLPTPKVRVKIHQDGSIDGGNAY